MADIIVTFFREIGVSYLVMSYISLPHSHSGHTTCARVKPRIR